MPTGRRPSHMSSTHRRPARRPAPPSGVDTMKVAGTLFCISAVISAVVAAVTREADAPLSAQTGAFGSAFFVLVLGLALIQGVNGVRVFVLGAAAVASLVSIGIAAVFHSIRELQVLALAIVLTAVGYFALLLQREASKVRVAVSLVLIVAGVAATLGAQLYVAGFARRAFGEELRKVASERRQYNDPTAGISIEAPAGWVILREDAELYQGVPSKVTLANPDAGTVAFVNYDQRRPGFVTLDHYLDAVLASLNEAGLEAQQTGRSDVTVGKASARRMELTWKEEDRPTSGFFSVWLDGDTIFMFVGAVPGPWTTSAEEHFEVLQRALQFTAPIETALTDAEARLTTECPMFTATSVRTIARRISPGSATEAYFKVGWLWALKGQGALDAAAQAELGQLFSEVYSGMSQADRTRVGAYSEKLRAGRRTTRNEDIAAMRILGQAARTIPPASLARLQSLTDAALTAGGLM